MAETIDVSAIGYFAPILAFLLIFLIVFLLLRKTKVFGDSNSWIDIFLSFVVATIFVSAVSVRQVVLNIIPWFALLVIALFFMLLITGFMGKTNEVFTKGMGWFFVVLLIIIFLVSSIKVFSYIFLPYLPGPYFGRGADASTLYFVKWFYSPRVIGAFFLLVIAGLVSWVLVKFTKDSKK